MGFLALGFGTSNSTSDNNFSEPVIPKDMTVSLQDVDVDSGRTADGTMHRTRVAGGASAKRKIALTYPPMSTSQISSLLQAMSASDFYVRYVDPYTGAKRTANVYAGDRSAPVYSTGLGLWTSMTVDLVEM